MRTELVRIGSSRGVRIPKPLIEQRGLGDTVELRVARTIVESFLQNAGCAKAGEASREAGPAVHDKLLLATTEPLFPMTDRGKRRLGASRLPGGKTSSYTAG